MPIPAHLRAMLTNPNLNFGKSSMKCCMLRFFFFIMFAAAAAGPAFATTEENYKENVNRFEKARQFFLSGEAPECADLLQGIMLDPQAGIYEHVRAARLLAELLRFLRQHEMLEKFKNGLEKARAELKTVLGQEPEAPLKQSSLSAIAYLEETLVFLDRNTDVKPLKSFLPLDAVRALELGQYAEILGAEDPVRRTQYEEALWEWARLQPPEIFGAPDSELSQIVGKASIHLSASFWARERPFDTANAPALEIFSGLLQRFSTAVLQKDQTALVALFHPASPDTTLVLNELSDSGVRSLEYSAFGLPRLSADGQSVSLDCRVKMVFARDGKSETLEGPKTAIFAKQGNEWLIEKL